MLIKWSKRKYVYYISKSIGGKLMSVNHNKFAIVDTETGGLGKGRQPLSIGVVILDARRLTVADNGVFYSQICPSTMAECDLNGLDPVDPKALAINKLNIEELLKAPKPKTVWENLINFMKYHNSKGDKWSAPIFTGWNTKFDWDIVDRMIYGHLPSKLTLPPTYGSLVFWVVIGNGVCG